MLDDEQRQHIVDIAYECVRDTMKLTCEIDFVKTSDNREVCYE